MPWAGLEPALPFGNTPLKRVCLPFHHHGDHPFNHHSAMIGAGSSPVADQITPRPAPARELGALPRELTPADARTLRRVPGWPPAANHGRKPDVHKGWRDAEHLFPMTHNPW